MLEQTADRIVAALERIAAALERLAPPAPPAGESAEEREALARFWVREPTRDPQLGECPPDLHRWRRTIYNDPGRPLETCTECGAFRLGADD